MWLCSLSNWQKRRWKRIFNIVFNFGLIFIHVWKLYNEKQARNTNGIFNKVKVSQQGTCSDYKKPPCCTVVIVRFWWFAVFNVIEASRSMSKKLWSQLELGSYCWLQTLESLTCLLARFSWNLMSFFQQWLSLSLSHEAVPGGEPGIQLLCTVSPISATDVCKSKTKSQVFVETAKHR